MSRRLVLLVVVLMLLALAMLASTSWASRVLTPDQAKQITGAANNKKCALWPCYTPCGGGQACLNDGEGLCILLLPKNFKTCVAAPPGWDCWRPTPMIQVCIEEYVGTPNPKNGMCTWTDLFGYHTCETKVDAPNPCLQFGCVETPP